VEEAGSTVVKVPPHHTSQVCHRCGTIVPEDLSVRWHSCPACGEELDRDHNSALEVLHRYQRQKHCAGAGSVPQEPVSLCGEARLLSKPPE
jgi:putative transposase